MEGLDISGLALHISGLDSELEVDEELLALGLEVPPSVARALGDNFGVEAPEGLGIEIF